MFGFNINRALLLAGMRLGTPEAMQLIQPPPPTMVPPVGRYRGVGAKGSHDRLALDRSSSVKKMQRWFNNGDIAEPPPSERHMRRHAWYRRQKEREARAAAKEAWNNV